MPEGNFVNSEQPCNCNVSKFTRLHTDPDAHVSRKISCLTIRVLPTIIKASCLAIRNTFLAKTSCSRQSFTHFARDFNLSQGNDLSDANDANTSK
ncbi:hypothetical protein LWI29_012285 [Acer saccharum]|uniref:Uncharacterized protein n=1 Tax=Acer saccharum TaxID=4024 RepID=A0AA39SDQ9_ACESA|nr:hypothetical protein LWI29_012285 [Acer saccharum]